MVEIVDGDSQVEDASIHLLLGGSTGEFISAIAAIPSPDRAAQPSPDVRRLR